MFVSGASGRGLSVRTTAAGYSKDAGIVWKPGFILSWAIQGFLHNTRINGG